VSLRDLREEEKGSLWKGGADLMAFEEDKCGLEEEETEEEEEVGEEEEEEEEEVEEEEYEEFDSEIIAYGLLTAFITIVSDVVNEKKGIPPTYPGRVEGMSLLSIAVTIFRLKVSGGNSMVSKMVP